MIRIAVAVFPVERTASDRTIVAIESQCTPDRTTAVRSVCELFQLLLSGRARETTGPRRPPDSDRRCHERRLVARFEADDGRSAETGDPLRIHHAANQSGPILSSL
ncbi:hypothetical protein GOC74_10380 [Halomicrobium mukohataei]|uniref:Uncharacterized protein n=1 Tax=Halomicrobium mukohataei TaxID=57705 RepID=A0A847UAB5_9EURY|nr:hypothetical protein [Halomicrobium mukohataei]